MVQSDLFKRSLEAGTTLLDLTRERAEAVVKEWVEAGDLGRGRAKKAVDDLLERSHRVTEELQGLVRREIRDQLAAMGVATHDDLARVEARIDSVTGDQAPVKKAAPTKKANPAKKAGPIKKANLAKKAVSSKRGASTRPPVAPPRRRPPAAGTGP